MDLQLQETGSFFLLTPLTAPGKLWMQANLIGEQTLLADGVAVEHRYVDDIILGITGDGLTVGDGSEAAPTPKRKLTQVIAREYIRQLGGKLKRDAALNEYRVVFGEDNDYFCTDLDDAIGTARIMAGGHQNFEDAERYLVEALGGAR